MSRTLQIISTRDGSPTVEISETGETYHSVHGALQESMHVFIEHGLRYFNSVHQKKEIRILEMGFGTGLNAWLTWQEAEQSKQRINYHTLEAFPVPEIIFSKLDFTHQASEFIKLHQCEWGREVEFASHFAITKWNSPIQTVPLAAGAFDIIFYDAFAPTTQPELWGFEVLGKVAHSMTPGAVFVTYCAKGEVKRTLKSLGLKVESLPGPPGKREMVRGTKVQ